MNRFALDFSPIAQMGHAALDTASSLDAHALRTEQIAGMQQQREMGALQLEQAKLAAEEERKNNAPIYVGALLPKYETLPPATKKEFETFAMAAGGKMVNGQLTVTRKDIERFKSDRDMQVDMNMRLTAGQIADTNLEIAKMQQEYEKLTAKREKIKEKYGNMADLYLESDPEFGKMDAIQDAIAQKKAYIVQLSNEHEEIVKQRQMEVAADREMIQKQMESAISTQGKIDVEREKEGIKQEGRLDLAAFKEGIKKPATPFEASYDAFIAENKRKPSQKEVEAMVENTTRITPHYEQVGKVGEGKYEGYPVTMNTRTNQLFVTTPEGVQPYRGKVDALTEITTGQRIAATEQMMKEKNINKVHSQLTEDYGRFPFVHAKAKEVFNNLLAEGVEWSQAESEARKEATLYKKAGQIVAPFLSKKIQGEEITAKDVEQIRKRLSKMNPPIPDEYAAEYIRQELQRVKGK